MIYTTLNRIHEHIPFADGWRKLLTYLGKTGPDDAPLAYIVILDAAGLDDALWCLRAEPQHESIWRMYAVRCARRRVQHLLTDERSLQALDVAERYARGLATDEELAATLDAARAAARAAAWDAIRAAADDAAWDVARDEQTADFRAMLAAHHAMPGESCALVDWWQEGSDD